MTQSPSLPLALDERLAPVADALAAADRFRMLFVADCDPPTLITDIEDVDGFTDAFAELSEAMAKADLALFVHSAISAVPVSQAVAIKPLEWGLWGGVTPLISTYHVRHFEDSTWGWHLAMGPEQTERFPTRDAARAAAQADYEARIRSALIAQEPAEGAVRGPCWPVTYCALATSTHVPVGSDEDHCDLCGHPAQPFSSPEPAEGAAPDYAALYASEGRKALVLQETLSTAEACARRMELREAVAVPTIAEPAGVAWQTRMRPTGAKKWGDWHFGRMTADSSGWEYEERRLYATPPDEREPLSDTEIQREIEVWRDGYNDFFNRAKLAERKLEEANATIARLRIGGQNG